MTRTYPRRLLVLFALVLCVPVVLAQGRMEPMQVNDRQVAQWNAFVDALYRFHRERIDGREVNVTSRVGGYHRYPDFYEEKTFSDAGSGRVLSRIRWERDRDGAALNRDPAGVSEPGAATIHSIAVYVYDEQGRVARDYSATFLPVYRNAPIQTLVFIHDYPDGLHAFRAFDASANLIYEVCRGQSGGREVDISLDEDGILSARAADGIAHTPQYGQCFGRLAESPGRYLLPQG
jgi:hypothetical protein